jgi:hypothetical protein
MAIHRLYSMLFYGAAALVASVTLVLMGYNPVLVVAMTFAAAALADRFVNSDAEPDERMRSFVIYAIGAIGGLLIILFFGSQLGSATWIAPVIGFAVLAVIDYLKPPAAYKPRDPHRYGESPPVTVR